MSLFSSSASGIRDRLHDPDQRPITIVLLLALLVPIAALGLLFWVMASVPEVSEVKASQLAQASVLYSHDGEELARYYDKNRRWVSLDSISQPLTRSLIATEDAEFYDHGGINFKRTVAAAANTLRGDTQGGSTITMQLARNIYPSIDNSPLLLRKAKEWLTAIRLENEYSKDELLTYYLNLMPWNFRAFGIEAAAQTYFGIPAIELDTLQAATLVGMLKGTTAYNPVLNPDQARERRNIVLQRLEAVGYIDEATRQRLSEQSLELNFDRPTLDDERAPYLASHLRDRLEEWAAEHGYDLYGGGLQIYTTIDARMQDAAQQAVRKQVGLLQNVVDASWSSSNIPYYAESIAAYGGASTPNAFDYYWATNPAVLDRLLTQTSAYDSLASRGLSENEAIDQLRTRAALVDSVKQQAQQLQGAMIAMDPESGAVRAWVGGRDYGMSEFDHVAQAKRQPGSTFKPFVYATALANGHHANTLWPDTSLTYRFEQTGKTWSPGNFGEETGQMLRLSEALARSKNTVTAQLMVELGPEAVADMARRMGVESELDEVLSLGLGTSPVSLIEMATAYSTIANQGRRPQPELLTRIEDHRGQVIARFQPESHDAVPPDIAYGTLDLMRGVVEEGTGVRIRHQYGASGDLAGKTGTTQNNADGWFFLLHPDLVVGAWVGFDQPAVTFRTRYWGQGSHNALHLVGDFYQQAELSREATFPQPPGWTPPPPPDTTRDRRGFDDRFEYALAGDTTDLPSTDDLVDGESRFDSLDSPPDPLDEPDTSRFGEPDAEEPDLAGQEEQADAEEGSGESDREAAPESPEQEEELSVADSLTRAARQSTTLPTGGGN